jgi:adenine-specific DNA-methyltransferase
MYILWYVKDYDLAQINKLFMPRGNNEISDEENEESIMLGDLTNGGFRKTTSVPFQFQNRTWQPGPDRCWSVNLDGMNRLARTGRIQPTKNQIRFKKFHSDFPAIPLTNLWTDTGGASDKVYAVQTPIKVIQRCLLMASNPGDLVFDPTCGSGTTALVAEQWGRRWITCDSSRVAVSIARKRILTTRYDYYELNSPVSGPLGGIRYRTVPHITIKSIAQNILLDEILLKHEAILNVLRNKLNTNIKSMPKEIRSLLRSKLSEKERSQGKRSITESDRMRWILPEHGWEEWEVPPESDPDWPEPLRHAFEDYHSAIESKMDDLTACIAAHTEQEALIDQPVIVKGITRVTGPFTVEAVMPPVESVGVEIESPIGGAPEDSLDTFGDGLRVEPQNAAAFQDQVLGLLRAGGVDFLGNKHVDFTRLDPLQGSMLHAEGGWLLPDKTQRRVAVSIGPRVGNVTDFQVEKALRQANLKGFQDLLFAGFGFDGVAQAVIQENAEELEGVQTHLFLIRPDVVMGDLLKNTAASQLFTAMGLPRTKLERLPNEEFAVHMDGVDIYDPVTNALIPTGADKVAAWFVDSDYDGRCFCITQAFFPDKSAWEKLAKALKSTVDEDRMEAFSGTHSLPFKVGKHQRVAVKVIDPRGNEVMAVHRLV